jgi:hypothetical protein
LFRWALHRAETSDRVFAENWGVYKDVARSRTGWARKHRERAMRTTLPRLPEYLAHGRIEWALEKFYQLRILRLDTSKSDDEAPVVPPPSHPRAVWKKRELN